MENNKIEYKRKTYNEIHTTDGKFCILELPFRYGYVVRDLETKKHASYKDEKGNYNLRIFPTKADAKDFIAKVYDYKAKHK